MFEEPCTHDGIMTGKRPVCPSIPSSYHFLVSSRSDILPPRNQNPCPRLRHPPLLGLYYRMKSQSMRMQLYVIAALVAAYSLVSFGQSLQADSETRPVDQYIPAVVQAVEDEIYDYNFENRYFLVDDQGAGDTKPAKISIFISRNISKDGDGVAIYKLMPYGEVYRLFVIQKDGVVVLLGDPQKLFLPTGGSVLTIYMADEKVCSFIQQRAIKSYFTVDPGVSKQRLDEAVQRQLNRVGFSYRRYLAKHAQKK